MKIYVAGYRQRRESRPSADAVRSFATVEVNLTSSSGDWLIETRRLADSELAILKGMTIRHGEHECRFEIEEQDGKFAIVCPDHSDS